MSRKIIEKEFLQRFFKNNKQSKIEIINYTAISNPCEIKCLQCGKKHYKKRARDFISVSFCCDTTQETKLEKIKTHLEKSEKFSFIKHSKKDWVIIKHNVCGNEVERTIKSALDNPFSCLLCETHKKALMISIDEAQKQIDECFGAPIIRILTYCGQLKKKNRYKCLKCGLIFQQKHTCLLQSRGCPKCHRWKSKGETQLKNILIDNKINFQEQVRFKELPLQSFDFGVYSNNKLICLIEVQGEQHFEKREIFKDGLKTIQKRDKKKKEFCKTQNIPLYEIVYKKGILKNIDILPFINSTTILVKEE